MNRNDILEKPSRKRRDDFLAAVERSGTLHGRWVAAPRTPESFDAYLRRLRTDTHFSYWVRTEDGELAGVFNISEVVRGLFCSGYLSYYAFAPHHGHGHMKRGLRAVLSQAFGRERLHRLEANIQPGNDASRRLVQGAGFRLEGFSPRYLKIAGRWRDHERWAITAEEWRPRSRSARNGDPRTFPVREARPTDAKRWLAMRRALWPDGSTSEHREEIDRFFAGRFPREPWAVLLAEDHKGRIAGFVELSVRPYAEGCRTRDVGYLEGWFVRPEARRSGVGRSLVLAAEDWARARGCAELASDADPANDPSVSAHRAVGFADAGVVRCFRKDL